MMLHPRLKALAETLLPKFLVARLDPFQEAIEREARAVATIVGDGQIVLDAGAGEARHKRYFRRGRYVAIDSGTGDPNWDYSHLDLKGDLHALPLRSQSVNHVLCFVVLEHTKDPKRVLAEFSRVLRPGGSLYLVLPFLWEEHQSPHDYQRFTRSGIHLLFADTPLRIEVLEPIGGLFWVCARRCVSFLTFFQQGWRWLLFVPLAPVFGLALPLALYFLDRMDRTREHSLGFRIRATKKEN
jgi:SAM-dependent methyltransferase